VHAKCENGKAKRQRLKPLGYCELYVAAKAATHKDLLVADLLVATQTLKPRL
jgi:hypothetical protein